MVLHPIPRMVSSLDAAAASAELTRQLGIHIGVSDIGIGGGEQEINRKLYMPFKKVDPVPIACQAMRSCNIYAFEEF